MRGCPRAIRYHSDTLAPSPTPESTRFGLCIYRTRDIRPFACQPLKRPFRVVKSRPAPKQRLPVQSNFFAVVLNPSTQAESTGFENSQFRVPMHRKSAKIVQNSTSPAAPTPIQPGAETADPEYGRKRRNPEHEPYCNAKVPGEETENAENLDRKRPRMARQKRVPTEPPRIRGETKTAVPKYGQKRGILEPQCYWNTKSSRLEGQKRP